LALVFVGLIPVILLSTTMNTPNTSAPTQPR